jgi:heat shock protein HslJ
MSMRMVMIVSVVLVLAACGDETVPTTDSEGIEGRTFLSESVTENAESRELVEGTRISLQFGDDGRLSANAGCNNLFTDVSIGADVLETGLVGGTEMGCDQARHDQDQWLSAFLESSPAWTLDGDRLTLSSGDSEIVLLDRRVADPDRALEGTRWVVDTIVTGDAASSMWAGTEGSAWLVIEEGGFTASTGCRDVDGSVEVSADRLRFSDAVQTDPACPPELADVDDVMLALLTGDVEYEIEAARLRVDHPDGVGLGFHADE